MKAIFGKKIRLGRLSIPIWAILAVPAVALAAGQAVGPVLAGSVTGSAGLTVAQAITLDVDNLDLDERIVVDGAGDAVTTTNDEGTEFSVAMELNVGQRVTAEFYLWNASGTDGAATLELNIPVGIDVEITDETDLEEGQLGRGTWLMAIDDEDSSFVLTIEPKDDLKPGFYTITGRLVQIGG